MSVSEEKSSSSNDSEIARVLKDNELEDVVLKVGDLSLTSNRILLGKVAAIIEETGVVTVEAESSETILNFGMSVLVKESIPGFETEEESYCLLGHVEDVFGSVKSPMYAVKIVSPDCNCVEIGEHVYYINNDPNSDLLKLTKIDNQKFRIVKQE